MKILVGVSTVVLIGSLIFLQLHVNWPRAGPDQIPFYLRMRRRLMDVVLVDRYPEDSRHFLLLISHPRKQPNKGFHDK